LLSASFSNELVDALKGKKSLLKTDTNIKYNKKPTCGKEILEAIKKNRISFFMQKKGELRALNDCLASEELTPLMIAAYSDKMAIVKLFLSDGVDPNEVSDKGYSPLHFAAFYGNYEIIIALLDAKADINAKNNSGQTPLMIAAYYGNAKSVSLLQDRGADTSITDKAGLTAKELAVKKKKREVLRVIR
jgi:ankyrin repeat protein